MKIGFIGLGKMGANMVERLLQGGHDVVAYDLSPDKVKECVAKGASGATTIEALINQLPERKVVWLMVPSGRPVDENIARLLPHLHSQDILIDGGNSYWRDTQKRAQEVEAHGIHYVDCGTSGGVWGLKNGYCLMYGGDKGAVAYLEPIFRTLSPENGQGYLYCGGNGAGHFVKMVHNGIEYGMMQAMAEGFEIMQKSPFHLDLPAISKVWQHGSVVNSWLLELASRALEADPGLTRLQDHVADSGEGRWTLQTAMDLDVPVHVIAASLFNRFQSRQEESFAMKLLAALRNQFGGHAIKEK